MDSTLLGWRLKNGTLEEVLDTNNRGLHFSLASILSTRAPEEAASTKDEKSGWPLTSYDNHGCFPDKDQHLAEDGATSKLYDSYTRD